MSAASEAGTLTRTLDVPGAVIAYDVRPAGGAGAGLPPLLLVGSPMGASGFGALATSFPDRTVVTYDPRGVERSTKADPTTTSTPAEHADDLHRVIVALGAGPVDLFASSGGAVNALALVAAHPDDVRTLVAHEPPLLTLLPDRDAASAATLAVGAAYQADGFGAGMARFIALVAHEGEFTAADGAAPGPDPAMFGLPDVDDGSRHDPLLFQNLESCTHHVPDVDALRAAPTRIVVGVGTDGAGTLAWRGGVALASLLGVDPVRFPGDHGGFLGGDGRAATSEAFAATLREILAGG